MGNPTLALEFLGDGAAFFFFFFFLGGEGGKAAAGAMKNCSNCSQKYIYLELSKTEILLILIENFIWKYKENHYFKKLESG